MNGAPVSMEPFPQDGPFRAGDRALRERMSLRAGIDLEDCPKDKEDR